MIERKGLEAIQQPNYIKLFMVTNEDYAVNASADERRWGVFDVDDIMIGNDQYFTELRKECNSKSVMASFLYDMLHYDITGWQPSNIPDSVGLKAQRQASLKSPGLWLLDCLNHGSFTLMDWEKSLAFSDLKKSYLSWCESHKVNGYDIVTDTALGRYLGKFFLKDKRVHQKTYLLGEHVDAKDIFCKIEMLENANR